MSSKTTFRGGATKNNSQPEPYDFRRPMTLAREHSRVLEMSFETYARQWSMQLTSRLRVMSTIVLDKVELTTYDEYINGLDPHTIMALVSLDESRPSTILQVSSKTAMLWIDYMLGGPGIELDGAERELTEIETNLVTGLLGNTMTDLKYAFASVHEMSPTIRSIQYSPQFVQAVPAKEAVLVAHFTMTVAEGTSVATMMVPADTLITPLRHGEGVEARSASDELEAQVAQERLKRAMGNVPMDVTVKFKSLTVNPRDVATLEVGQVIRLNHPVTKPLEVMADHLLVASAVPGTSGTTLACRIVSNELGGTS
ncbi:flagellar motor switch protein FliM [Timonella sp. A28]|uniref:flagellar motor switch protein FliM n=1 Tax=Timonella sp. A28 TaxID=3442640 RepID=UPI003EBA3859